MRLVGFNEEKIKFLDPAQLAVFVEEENRNLAGPHFGHMPSVGSETALIMMAHSLNGKHTLLAKVYEMKNSVVKGTELQVRLYADDMPLEAMYFKKGSLDYLCKLLASYSLTKPVLVNKNSTFVETALEELIKTSSKENETFYSVNVALQKVLDDYRVSKAARADL